MWLKLCLDLLKEAWRVDRMDAFEPPLVLRFMEDLVAERFTRWPFKSHSWRDFCELLLDFIELFDLFDLKLFADAGLRSEHLVFERSGCIVLIEPCDKWV